MITNEERGLWVALAAVPGVGRRTFRRIFNTLSKHKTSITQFWVSLPLLVEQCNITKKQLDSIYKFKKEYEIYSFEKLLARRGIRAILFWEETHFPRLLAQIDDAPAVIYVRSRDAQLPWIGRRLVGMIGSRNMTPYGKQVAQKVVPELISLGLGTVSGCMYGVDAAVHQATIQAGGVTIGVLGYGFDHCYPSSVARLQDRIIESGGALISEYAPYVSPQKGQFAERNRIISGLSEAVVIVEAAEGSGTLITAQCALDQGRAVCAVPGPITSPYCEGTKWLLNQGAVLVSSGGDVFDELPSEPRSALQNDILSLLAQAPTTSDYLLARLQTECGQPRVLTSAVLNQALTELEINGSIMRNANHYELSHR